MSPLSGAAATLVPICLPGCAPNSYSRHVTALDLLALDLLALVVYTFGAYAYGALVALSAGQSCTGRYDARARWPTSPAR